MPKTVKATLAEYQNHLPLTVLSQTFKDAVVITRELGFRYIWIDALCIVQDDDEDWRREAIKMHTVYGNATLTIAVAASSSGTQGYLSARKDGERLVLSSASLLETQLVMKTAITHSLWHALEGEADLVGGWAARSEQHPLILRKWCFQERILSRRILYYSIDELVWECRKTVLCECGDPPFYATLQRTVKTRYDNLLLDPIPGDSPGLSVQDRSLETWLGVVAGYSRVRLTYNTDVLVALSGVVQKFATASLGNYCAGMWTYGLLYQLCWKSEVYGTQKHTRSTSYLAPSWSWASIQGHVEMGFLSTWKWSSKDDFDARVVSVHCTLSGPDPYGQVTGGRLELETRALCGKIAEAVPIRGFFSQGGGLYDAQLRHALTFEEPISIKACTFDTEDEATGAKGKTVWIVSLWAHFYKGPEGEKRDHGFFLLLEANSDGTYRRIGIVSGNEWLDGLPAQLDKAPRTTFVIV